jgi:hypothetical protein
MDDKTKEVIAKNREYLPEQIEISPYCQRKMAIRGVDEDLIRTTLISNKDIIYTEPQKKPFEGRIEERYKMVYKLSGRYYLIIVIVHDKRILKVVNVIKTSKDMEALWQEKISS